MNKRLTRSLAESSQLGISTSRYATSILVIGFIALTAIYLIVANILGKIGLDQSGLYTMGIFVPVGVFLVAGVATRITGTRGLGGIDEFRRAAGKIDAVGNAMAGSAEWFSLFFIVGIIAALTSTNHDGISISVGALAGLAFIAIFVLPKLPPQTTISLPDLITTKADGFEFGKKLLGPALAIIAIFCALLFLIAQIGAGSHVLLLQFPLSVRWAAGLLLMPVVFTLLASGMRGLTFANILLIWVIAAAILLPVVWLSMRITGNPFAQLSYGDGALQPILELEEQLVSSNLQNSGVGFQQGNFSKLSDFWNFLATVICITAGDRCNATFVFKDRMHNRICISHPLHWLDVDNRRIVVVSAAGFRNLYEV